VTITHYHTTKRSLICTALIILAGYLEGAQVQHVLTRDYAILAATHMFIRSGISLPLLQGHRSSLHFGWYSFPAPLRVESWVGLAGLVKYWGGLSAQRWLPIPAAVGIELVTT